MGSYIIYPIVYLYAAAFYVLIKGRVGFALFLLILFLFAALRGDVGNDACSYQEIYNHFNLQKRDLHLGRIEPVFAMLNIALNFFGFGHQSLFIAIAGIQSIIYLKIYQHIDSNTKWLLVFVVLMYYYFFQFNTIRYGLAAIIFSFSFILYLKGKTKMSTVMAILSIGTHIATVPLLLLMRRFSFRYIVVIVVTIFLYSYFIDPGLMISKLKYIDIILEYKLEFRKSMDSFIVRTIALLAVILWLVKDIYYKYLFLFFILGIGTLDAFMPVVGRFSELYVFMLLIYLSYIGVRRRVLFVLYPFLLFSVYSHMAHPIIKGDEIISQSRITQEMPISSGVRYSFYFEDDQLICK